MEEDYTDVRKKHVTSVIQQHATMIQYTVYNIQYTVSNMMWDTLQYTVRTRKL